VSKVPSDPSEDFPDVRISLRLALLAIIGLTGAYAVIFVLLGAGARSLPIELIASLGLATVLLLLSYIDLRTGLLPDLLTIPLGLTGLIYASLIEGYAIWSIGGAVVGYGLVAGLSSLWCRLRGYEGIGLGDAKLLGAIGAWVGLPALPIVLLIGSGLGILIALIGTQKEKTKTSRFAIPFGPFLAIGGWTAWCLEEMSAVL